MAMTLKEIITSNWEMLTPMRKMNEVEKSAGGYLGQLKLDESGKSPRGHVCYGPAWPL